ncbi:MAG TPA: tRNA pseudouridine(55) synthase TruB [Gemmatimonadales bacterium]|nr:tRNA pseudouridine(55) synthase TruB [Gemmatimonadales bacterium]
MDKPAGMSSHDVVQRVRRTLGIRAAGHTGTLDPFATGLLIVLLGRATRLARFIERQPKRYLATARLGAQTTTDDLTGEIIAESNAWARLSESRVRETLATFHGEQLQTPPTYSAKQVAGVRSYRRARRGDPVQLVPVHVTIHAIDLVEYAPPDLSFRTVVSAGTYIRAIARDLGTQLGVGAHLIALRREAIGSLSVEDAVTLDSLDQSAVLPPHAVLGDMPSVDLDEASAQAVSHGRSVVDQAAAGRRDSGAVALVADGRLVGVAEASNGWLRPTVVLGSS